MRTVIALSILVVTLLCVFFLYYNYSGGEEEIILEREIFYVDGMKFSRFITPSGDICYSSGGDTPRFLSCIPVE